jgi:hypothetical protein
VQHNRFCQAVVLAGSLFASMGQVRAPDPLTVARQLYNEQRFAEAVQAAEEARTMPGAAAAATVVFSRAHLELFRQSSETASLTAARDALKTVSAAELSPRDQVELLIALGVTLYLDDQHSLDDRFSAAAEQFEVALGHADLLDGRIDSIISG